MMELTAENFIAQLHLLQSDDELQKIKRYFKTEEGQYSHSAKFIGVKMGQLFALAKQFIACRRMKSRNCWTAKSTKCAPVQ